ncbi:hypothetical protein BC629DRAFT_1117136 [Irpex lacteus]|nr:hypothetical protein BC629DRAFT_1117136 [Irpex lacteus]
MSDYFSSQHFVPQQDDQTSRSGSTSSSDGVDGAIERRETLGQRTPVGTPSENTPPFPSNTGPTIQVSNTFNLHANLDILPPNVILVSLDKIFFTVHYHRLLALSLNDFGGLLQTKTEPTKDDPLTLMLPEVSDILNILLHCIYDISCDTYHPTFECLAASLPILTKYGLLLQHHVARGKPLFNTLLNHGPIRPLETYTLAASHALEDLAVAASSYTLHIKVYNLAQPIADTIGTVYLQRLHHLHNTRMDGLRALLNEKIFPHVAKPYCSVEQRQVVSRAYHLAGAQVFYDATPAISRPGIEIIMSDLIAAVTCPDCKESLVAHVENLIAKWMLFKRTI